MREEPVQLLKKRDQVPVGGDIPKKVKIEVGNFDERAEPYAFLDGLADLEDCFEWYDMSDYPRIRNAKLKLVGYSKHY